MNIIVSLLLLLVVKNSISFNFETRLPLIKRGGHGSYFGFSVAEHQVGSTPSPSLDNCWLLVGAPLDQNRQPSTKQSGALWKCPMTTLHSDCEQVITDGKRDIDQDSLLPPQSDEIKDGQWLGVTVKSQGKDGKVLVCAHRYIKQSLDNRYGRGLCYTLNNDLSLEDTVDPCKGRPTERAHEQYGFCQVGTSGVIVNDTAVVGAPGPYTWKGAIFVFSVSSHFLFRDKTIYYSPHSDDTSSPVDKFSYLGMSVCAANFFGNELAFAAGAPRSNGTGQVIIFRIKRKSFSLMQTDMILNGDMYTSNFGYEVATADVNGDGLPDLIVGAPNYFDKNRGGAVYIYVNHKSECSLQCEPPIKITGEPESRFGIAITNLGDINKDGYEDIAIGAPYEEKGAIYVYLGSKNGTIITPSQIIRGEDYNIETFGYSLSGGIDLDNNGYPDLLTGAFESSAVVLLRTRPIIEITTKIGPEWALKKIDPTLNECKTDPHSELACFTFEACVSVQAVMKDRILKAGSGLKLNCTLQADITRRFARVFIGPETKLKPHTVHRVISLRQDSKTQELKNCNQYTVYIKEDTKDIQSAVSMRLSYSMIQDNPKPTESGDPLPKMDNYPILNQQQADKIFQATFLKDCGDNDICESRLLTNAFLNLPYSRASREKYDLILGEYEEVLLNATVYNYNESAYESYLIIKHSPSLSYIAQQGNAGSTRCERVNETEAVCYLGNPLERNRLVNVVLRFEPLNSIDDAKEVTFKVSANTTSHLLEPQDEIILSASIIRKADLKIKGSVRPEEVLYGGKVRGESEMIYKDQPGSRLRHIYEIVNDGPWHVNNLEVVVDWPFQVANNKPLGKWLLYMDDEPTIEAEEGGVCYTSPNRVNPLKLRDRHSLLNSENNSSSTLRSRRKRDLEMVVRKGPDNIVRMNCRDKTAKCFRIKCTIFRLYNKQSAVITIVSRLWNSTLVEDYPKVKSVEIASNAKLVVPTGLVLLSYPTDIEAQAVTIARGGGFAELEATDGVELWMILVGVVAGLLLLLLFAVCLWKCGFFKRTRPDPTLTGNLNKPSVDDYRDY